MRFAARLTGVLLLTVGLLAGCDKAQIAQLESQNATITITASDTLAELFNVWDFTEITDLDMMNGPDDPTVYLYCESVPVVGTPPPPPIQIPVQTAWQHSLRVSVLRADSTEFEQISDDMYLSSTANLTPYDDQVIFGNNVTKSDLTVMDGTCTLSGDSCLVDMDCLSVPSGGPVDTCSVVLRTFHWANGTKRQLTAINRNVILATSNPLNDFDPVTYGFRNGLCSVSIDPGPSSLAGAPQPFTFELGKGDTLKVEARKALNSPGFVDQMGNPLTVIEPKLVGRLAIDGTNITNLGGDASSASVVGDGFSFFYSSR
ncbi:MAG: hypothetical protein E2P01_05960 [Acidobacteria bacterium]|nr:MAG: hypothetical protein E2P01_05960 [Acidobacteriota bacterium]